MSADRGDGSPDESDALDDGARLVDAFLGFRAALTATGATELGTLAEFVE